MKVFNSKGYLSLECLIKSTLFNSFILTRSNKLNFYEELGELCNINNQIDDEKNIYFLRNFVIRMMIYYNKCYLKTEDIKNEEKKESEKELEDFSERKRSKLDEKEKEKDDRNYLFDKISIQTNNNKPRKVNHYMDKIINMVIQKEITPNDVMNEILSDVKNFPIEIRKSTNTDSTDTTKFKVVYPDLQQNSCKCGVKSLREIYNIQEKTSDDKYFLKCHKCKKEKAITMYFNYSGKKIYSDLCSPSKIFNSSENLLNKFFVSFREKRVLDEIFYKELIEVLINLLIYIKEFEIKIYHDFIFTFFRNFSE